MKKIILLMMMLLSVLLLSGCASRENHSATNAVDRGELTIDFSSVIGSIKPLNGINNGPTSQAVIRNDEVDWLLDATSYYQECQIPFVRTHDTEYPDGGEAFIDIHCIFPDMSRDPDDPEAYHFAYTDAYILNIINSGSDVYYRLGESIAISAKEAKYQHPPENVGKWADVCAHIIAHYNQGWDNGFTYDIRYWQIWNEPDQARQWSGDLKDYCELYTETARYIKTLFPDVLVGLSAYSSVTEENLQALLDGIRADGKETPVDFVGWHIYTNDASKIAYRAEMIRKVLDRNGYKETQTFLDEWNYVNDWEKIDSTWTTIRSSSIAAFYAACLMAMQDSPVDGAMYYDGSFTGNYAFWCGLYDEKGKVLPGYYGFYAFSKLRILKNQVRVIEQDNLSKEGIYVCAASGQMEQGILISNMGEKAAQFLMKTNSVHTQADLMRVRKGNPDIRTDTISLLSDERTIVIESGEMLYIRLYSD